MTPRHAVACRDRTAWAAAFPTQETIAPEIVGRVRTRHRSGTPDVPIIVPVTEALSEVDSLFKSLPGHERHLVPRSEYLFSLMQPDLEDLLFLGSSYETYFDQLEVFWALLFANTREETTNIWGPPGRFAWKQQRGYGGGPLDQVTNEAQQAGAQWEPLRNGLFQGSEKRFTEIASEYRDLLARYPLR